VADDPQSALRAGADGVHINGEGEQLEAALCLLKPGHFVGAGGSKTRHAAVIAGEAGAGYVMFGGGGELHDDTVTRMGWWAEIFNVPCVGLWAGSRLTIGDLNRAGAEFIALSDEVFADSRGPVTRRTSSRKPRRLPNDP
jgi:thiamine-phosphate pyrophosphorylase